MRLHGRHGGSIFANDIIEPIPEFPPSCRHRPIYSQNRLDDSKLDKVSKKHLPHIHCALSLLIGDPACVTMAGQLLSSGSGKALTLADQDSEAPALVMGYKAQLPSGASYIGVARFACTPL